MLHLYQGQQDNDIKRQHVYNLANDSVDNNPNDFRLRDFFDHLHEDNKKGNQSADELISKQDGGELRNIERAEEWRRSRQICQCLISIRSIFYDG
jgi:hypothetical protein